MSLSYLTRIPRKKKRQMANISFHSQQLMLWWSRNGVGLGTHRVQDSKLGPVIQQPNAPVQVTVGVVGYFTVERGNNSWESCHK